MIAVIAIGIALILVTVFSNPATRACRWREFPADAGQSRWHCVTCGAEIEAPRGKRPRRCFHVPA